MITSHRSKYMISGYQPARADNHRARITLSHMQTWGYRWQYRSKYVIIRDYYMTIFISYPVSTWDFRISPRLPYQPEGRRPEGWYGSRGLIRKSIWKLPYHDLFIIYFYWKKSVWYSSMHKMFPNIISSGKKKEWKKNSGVWYGGVIWVHISLGRYGFWQILNWYSFPNIISSGKKREWKKILGCDMGVWYESISP